MGQELIKNMNEELKKLEQKGKSSNIIENAGSKIFNTEVGITENYRQNVKPDFEEENSINIEQGLNIIGNMSEIKKEENKSKLIESGINISRVNLQFNSSEQKKLLVS